MKCKRLSQSVEDYLKYHRGLGVALRGQGEELRRFARFADQIRHRGPLTTELALRWAKLPKKCCPHYWARRLDIV